MAVFAVASWSNIMVRSFDVPDPGIFVVGNAIALNFPSDPDQHGPALPLHSFAQPSGDGTGSFQYRLDPMSCVVVYNDQLPTGAHNPRQIFGGGLHHSPGYCFVPLTANFKKADQIIRQTVADTILQVTGWTIDPDDIYFPMAN